MSLRAELPARPLHGEHAAPATTPTLPAMTEPSEPKIPQDRGFKNLFETYPKETLDYFTPDIIQARGMPVTIEVLVQNEVPLIDLRRPSRFLDIALIATFADGSTIILVEHWSDAREVDYERVALYVISLRLRHRKATILPVVFVTDPNAGNIPDRWSMSVLGVETMSLRVRIVRVTVASIPELHRLAPGSRVAAALLALAYGPGIDSALRAGSAFAKAPGTIDDFKLGDGDDRAHMKQEEYWKHLVKMRVSRIEFVGDELFYFQIRSLCGEIWTNGIAAYIQVYGLEYPQIRQRILDAGFSGFIEICDRVRVLYYRDAEIITNEQQDAYDSWYFYALEKGLINENEMDSYVSEKHAEIIAASEGIDAWIEAFAVKAGLHEGRSV